MKLEDFEIYPFQYSSLKTEYRQPFYFIYLFIHFWVFWTVFTMDSDSHGTFNKTPLKFGLTELLLSFLHVTLLTSLWWLTLDANFVLFIQNCAREYDSFYNDDIITKIWFEFSGSISKS